MSLTPWNRPGNSFWSDEVFCVTLGVEILLSVSDIIVKQIPSCRPGRILLDEIMLSYYAGHIVRTSVQNCSLSTVWELPCHEVGGIIYPRPMGNLWGSMFSSLEYRQMSGV